MLYSVACRIYVIYIFQLSWWQFRIRRKRWCWNVAGGFGICLQVNYLQITSPDFRVSKSGLSDVGSTVPQFVGHLRVAAADVTGGFSTRVTLWWGLAGVAIGCLGGPRVLRGGMLCLTRWWNFSYFWNFHQFFGGKMKPFWRAYGFKGVESSSTNKLNIC